MKTAKALHFNLKQNLFTCCFATKKSILEHLRDDILIHEISLKLPSFTRKLLQMRSILKTPT